MRETQYSHAMQAYWISWFLGSFLSFLIPETWELLAGRPQDTLSAAVWRLEGITTAGQWNPLTWTAGHLLFTGVYVVVFVWLAGHFGLGIWR